MKLQVFIVLILAIYLIFLLKLVYIYRLVSSWYICIKYYYTVYYIIIQKQKEGYAVEELITVRHELLRPNISVMEVRNMLATLQVGSLSTALDLLEKLHPDIYTEITNFPPRGRFDM